MKSKKLFFTHKLMPGLCLSALIGVLTGVLIFLFKRASSFVITLSGRLYAEARENVLFLPLLVLSAALLGLAAGLLLKRFHDCRGGGIPTAVASIRGLVPLRWIQGIFVLFGSAMLTYLGGLPLGNEGPSVQMGTAVGKGSARLLGKQNRSFERYAMTGGACAGFAAATGAPLTGILFALEEAHRRFSPVIFLTAAVSVVTGSVTNELLCRIFRVDPHFFGFAINHSLSLRRLWLSALIGLLCGLLSILFTKLYSVMRALERRIAEKAPYALKIAVIFAVTALLGWFGADFVGSGHGLIERLMERETVWYMIPTVLLIRALLLTSANSKGVSGGLFVPTLAFGALIAALTAEGALALGLVEEEMYGLLVTVGMAAFLSGASQTPITAIAFAAEALCGVGGILPVGIGVVISYLAVELSGVTAFSDNVIESKTEAAHRGKTAVIVDLHVNVEEASFADGMELCDLLLPPTCTVLSIDRRDAGGIHGTVLYAGDRLHLHYQTFDPSETLGMLTDLFGEQLPGSDLKAHFGSDAHVVPPQ